VLRNNAGTPGRHCWPGPQLQLAIRMPRLPRPSSRYMLKDICIIPHRRCDCDTSSDSDTDANIVNSSGSLPRPRMRFVSVRTGSLETASTRTGLSHAVRIFTGARTAKTCFGVRVPGVCGCRAPVPLGLRIRCVRNHKNGCQSDGSCHADLQSHESPPLPGSTKANAARLGRAARSLPAPHHSTNPIAKTAGA
jgi:hypothetical protein